MSKNGMAEFADGVERALNYCKQEYRLTYAEAVGVLIMQAVGLSIEGMTFKNLLDNEKAEDT